MNILIIGYGRMGRTIEQLAQERGHTITGIIDEKSTLRINDLKDVSADVAIEFTQPTSAFDKLITFS